MDLFFIWMLEFGIFLFSIYAVKWNYKHYKEWPERRLLMMRLYAGLAVFVLLACILCGYFIYDLWWYKIREYVWFT